MRLLSSICSRVNRLCYHCSIVIPLGAVYSMITWGWIIFSGTICVQSIGGPMGFSLAIISSFLYGMTFWSYTRACLAPPGCPAQVLPDSNNAAYTILPQHNASQPSFTSVTVKDDGTERYCQKCRCKKPDRTHHCRSCGRCVLKMDHHCPWLATCVGFHNQKPFLLFLLYVSVWCILMCTVTSLFLWDFFTVNIPEEVEAQFLPINWVVLAILSGVVSLVVGGFGAWHVSLVLRNYTTIEYMEETRFKGDQKRYLMAQSVKDKFNIFDLSYTENWTQVMGSRIYLWFLPLPSDRAGDGYNFAISERARERLRIQQSLHSFERTYEAPQDLERRYELDDYRESLDWQRR